MTLIYQKRIESQGFAKHTDTIVAMTVRILNNDGYSSTWSASYTFWDQRVGSCCTLFWSDQIESLVDALRRIEDSTSAILMT